MAHATSWRRRRTCDKGKYGLRHARFDISRGFLFSRAANFTNQHNSFRIRIAFKKSERIDVAGADDRVAANPYSGTLAETLTGKLINRFVGKRTRAGNQTDVSR